MAKVKVKEVKFKYEVKVDYKNLTVLCKEGEIKLGENPSQTSLKYVFEEITDGAKYIKRVVA